MKIFSLFDGISGAAQAFEFWLEESKPEPKIDMKEECVDPVSIWKDVSELPRDDINYFICVEFFSGMMIIAHAKNKGIFKLHGDHEYPLEIIKRWCYLTDFINSFEQMQKDIEELKRK